MEYNKRISGIAPGDEVEGYYILKSANPKVAANGKPFLTGALSDKTGTIELKVWDYPGPLGTGDEGKVVKVRGTAGEYRGTVQFTAGRIRLAAEDDPAQTMVRDIMTRSCAAVSPHADCRQAAQLMSRQQVRRLLTAPQRRRSDKNEGQLTLF